MKTLILLTMLFGTVGHAALDSADICKSEKIRNEINNYLKVKPAPEVDELSVQIKLIPDESGWYRNGSCKFVYKTVVPVDERYCDIWYRAIFVHPNDEEVGIEEYVDYDGWCDY